MTARNSVAARHPASCDGLDEEFADASKTPHNLYTGLVSLSAF